MTKLKRKYYESWKHLKQSFIIKAQLTTSDSANTIKRFSRTFIRGVQKEKYQDTAFRVKYPNAELTSDIDLSTGIVTIKLDRNDYTFLEEASL